MIPSGTRFIGIADSVDLTEKKSAGLNAETQPYTIEDIKGYKVFTALLTQSGGDGPFNPDGVLLLGVTYLIDDSIVGDDFTNVGGPLITYAGEFVGTYFVATGTTPNNWVGGTGLVGNTGAPVVNVLENTIGNVWFEYTPGQPGTYFIGNDLPYPGLYGPRSWGISGPAGIIGSETKYFVTIQGSQVRIGFGDDEVYEGKLNSTPIEIRVYN